MTSRRAHVVGGEGAWLGAMDRVHGRLDVAVARRRWQRGLEVEGTGVASVVQLRGRRERSEGRARCLAKDDDVVRRTTSSWRSWR